LPEFLNGLELIFILTELSVDVGSELAYDTIIRLLIIVPFPT